MAPPVPAYVCVSANHDFLCMTVAAAFLVSIARTEREIGAYLVIGEDQRIGQDDIFSSSSCKYDDFSDVGWCQGLAAAILVSFRKAGLEIYVYLRINGISLRLVAIKSHNREFLCSLATRTYPSFLNIRTHSLDLSRINLNDPNPSSDQLPPQTIRKTANGCLGSTVNATSLIWFPTGNTADIDDIARTAVSSLLEDWEDGLCHIDQTRDVCCEHDVDVLFCDFGGFGYAFD